mmetsp:Transcript_4877/g.9197  ORF Transcript_4877/g.9197 Transcript_4877/m.9197 type:complete len:108 (+) Transcript_4877:309-632(+)
MMLGTESSIVSQALPPLGHICAPPSPHPKTNLSGVASPFPECGPPNVSGVAPIGHPQNATKGEMLLMVPPMMAKMKVATVKVAATVEVAEESQKGKCRQRGRRQPLS